MIFEKMSRRPHKKVEKIYFDIFSKVQSPLLCSIEQRLHTVLHFLLQQIGNKSKMHY